MSISAKTNFCVVIGNPVNHSLSPAMHNAAYKSLGIENEFVYLGANVNVENVKDVIAAMRSMSTFRGLACTIPHKVEVIKHLDEIDEVAKKISAVNTVVNTNGKLKGFNTDWLGVIIPLEKLINLKNKKVAVIGAGGAARAIIYGLKTKGAKPIIFNRTIDNALKLAKEFNCEGYGLNKLELVKDVDVIINSTTVGMHPLENESPVPEEFIQSNHVVFDIVYVPYETKLLKIAKEKGATIIHGMEMLLHQGTAQFELYTNNKAPEEVMRKVLLDSFK
ncbi:MAG: shikimate dehydrogenase [bacterium]|nr:shikimate dehydrogenase [bacterium]